MTRRLVVLAVCAAVTAACGSDDGISATAGRIQLAAGEQVTVDDAALVDVEPLVEAVADEYLERPGVRDVAYLDSDDVAVVAPEQMMERWSDGHQLDVFLADDADAVTVDTIGADLAAEEHVVAVHFVDKQTQYEEFVEYFEDMPEVLENVTAEDLPRSFEVSFGGGPAVTVEDVAGGIEIEGVEPGEVTVLVESDGEVIPLEVVVLVGD